VKDARVGLLAGPIGVGKTTVAGRVVGLARRQGIACGGVLTPALRNRCGQKVGIWGVDLLTGERRILARTDRDLGGSTVGPYSFAQYAIEWAVSVIETAMHPIETAAADMQPSDLIIVDEIGKLELWQGMGLAPILPRLAAGEATHALVLVRDSLLSELRHRLEPIEPIEFLVSEENRGGLAPLILEGLFGLSYPTAG
jgi:nucleoside-triphosphatase THEP1